MVDNHIYPLILASRSPRRRALLVEAGYEFEQIVADDTAEQLAELKLAKLNLTPDVLVQRLAQAKAGNVAQQLVGRKRLQDWIVLAADTVAEIDHCVLGKPLDRNDAKRMLQLLSGRIHEVHTGICLRSRQGNEWVDVATTRLRMDKLSEDDIEAYLETNKWEGKAAAFGYQDGWDWLHVIQGEESNVVGLPLDLLKRLLTKIIEPR